MREPYARRVSRSTQKTGPAPQSIPFASRVRCLVALVRVSAYNRSQAGIVGRRASLKYHSTLNRLGASEFRQTRGVRDVLDGHRERRHGSYESNRGIVFRSC